MQKNSSSIFRLVSFSVLTASLALMPLLIAAKPAGSVSTNADSTQWLTQILWKEGSRNVWTLKTFQKLARDGITGVEINVNWQAIEPKAGSFQWNTLNTYLKYCEETHLQLIPIFWEEGYPGNPPSWLPGGKEETSAEAPAEEPAFWSRRAFRDYSTFVRESLTDLDKSPAFGGAYIDYGWLDAGYGPAPTGGGFAGYAPQDIAEFHRWLGTQYTSIADFDKSTGASYKSFDAVPAYAPGETHFPIYQQFRLWSYKILLGRLLAVARSATQKPLFIYYGGGLSVIGELGNLPNILFPLAQKYDAAITMDNANLTGLDALFGTLSQEYHVPVLNEWTPEPGGKSQLAQWLGQYPLEGAYRDGEDYFIYGGRGNQPSFEPSTFPSYVQWHDALAAATGSLPRYRVGIMLGYDQVLNSATGQGVGGGSTMLDEFLLNDPAATVFSDLSVLAGKVSLSQFHTIIDWNSELSPLNVSAINPTLRKDLARFKQSGGKIVEGPLSANPNPEALLNVTPGELNQPDVPPSFVVTPNNTNIQAYASVAQNKAYIVISNQGSTSFQGTVLTPAAMTPILFPNNKHVAHVRDSILLGQATLRNSGTAPSWSVKMAPDSLIVMAVTPIS